MFESIAYSEGPEYRNVDDLPANAVDLLASKFPDGIFDVEFMRTYLPDKGEEVFQKNIIAFPFGRQYSPFYITNQEELSSLLEC